MQQCTMFMYKLPRKSSIYNLDPKTLASDLTLNPICDRSGILATTRLQGQLGCSHVKDVGSRNALPGRLVLSYALTFECFSCRTRHVRQDSATFDVAGIVPPDDM